MKLKYSILILFVICTSIIFQSCDQKDKGAEFNVLVWNIWHGGNDESLPQDGRPSVVEIINQSGADIVLMIETYGSAPYIAEQTGMNYELLSSNLCIFSRFPIKRKIDFPESISTFNFGGVEILIEDSLPVLFFDTWLHYLPDTRLAPLGEGEEAILAWENEGSRDDEVKAIVKVLNPLIKESRNIPIILGGDLNSHSHLDWTEKTKNLYDHGGEIVNWTISRVLYEAGFKDAYREINPDPLKFPGKTWISGHENGKLVYTRTDRIDYCYFIGDKVKPLSSESFTAIPGDTLTFKDQRIMYPSDHGFVLTRYRLKR